tara:strand:+ start:9894 stop:10277 length:384 start_codon:yes stop_codon:yes gene_type:complete
MCKKDFEANDGRTYTLVIPDEGDRISAELCGNEVGYIALDYISGEYKRPGDYYYITDLAMNRCKGIGIGEEALRFHKEIFDTPIVAAPERGPKMQDGSHLIDDGLPFIRRMREKGIVCPEPSEPEDS